MNVSSIISVLEDGVKGVNNRNAKIEKAKTQFSNDIGVNEEMADKAEELIDTFSDMDDAYENHKQELKDCDAEIKRLVKSIQNWEDKLNNATTQSEKDNAQMELDKKRLKLNDANAKRNNIIKRRDDAESKRNAADRKFLKLFGRNIDKSKDISALNNKNAAIANISQGNGLAKSLSKLKGGPWMVAIDGLIKAVELGIGKATEYARLNAENLMREMNATAQVALNQLKANIASWQDSLSGAYMAQDLALDSQMALLQAQNANQLASVKLAHTWTNWIPIWGSINKYQEAALELEQKYAETRLLNASKFIKQVNEFTKLTDDYLKKQDNAVHQYQTKNGLTINQTDVFEKRMLTQAETFAKYNKTIEDVLKLQTNYIEQSGRAVNFSNADYENATAIGRLVGDDVFTQFSVNMTVFNQSVSSSAEIMYDMYKYANKMGLSQQKLTKNVLSNLKLANKYDFRNGSKGFIELAKWAENTRFNLNSLGSMLEKIQSGGLEGSITTAAKLQVLGGQFAMGADPLAMEYEANADPDAYAKRIKQMFGDMGRVDPTTGETTFNYVDNKLIRAAAEALGMPVEDAKDIIREDNKKQVVKRQITNRNLTTEQIDSVANKAQRNAETGQWEVSMLDGTTKSVDALTPADLQKIVSDSHEESMTQYAQSTLSSVEKIERATKSIAAMLGADTFDNFAQTAESSINDMIQAFTNNENQIVTAIQANREESLKAQKDSYRTLQTIGSRIQAIYDVLPHEWRETSDKDTQERQSQQGRNQVRLRNDKQRFDNEENVSSAMVMFHRAKAEGRNVWAQVRDWSRGFFMSDDAAIAKANETTKKWDDNFDDYGYDQRPIIAHDGMMSANGMPMTIAASSVTPIHDGNVQFAKTDPQDSAIFAKVGGPFDKLFGGVFNKVNDIYATLRSDDVTPNYMPYVFPEPPVVNMVAAHKESQDNHSINRQPIDIKIHGDINLNSNGQSYDISHLVENDPIFVRKLTELILSQLSDNINGGKHSLWQTRPFLG